MCGICGKLNFAREEPVLRSLMVRMANTMVHRGPDDEGYHLDGEIGLGFRRLSIIDLATGHQPLSNEDGTVWIVFNGEIYNFQDLRTGLEAKGHIFRTKSDTEVIVHLYEEYGTGCVERLRGMFAFAIWDSRARSLLLARDRLGIKPLYYREGQMSLLFASEIKAILADPAVTSSIRPEMIDRFLSFYYMPGEDTLFQGVMKLPPASFLLARDGNISIHSYWQLNFHISARSMHDAEQELIEDLEECVRLHMVADVPVGFLLSVGVDSTAMLSFSVGKTRFPLSSYTLGFAAPDITDERPYARLAADTYGSRHYETTITADDFRNFLPDYVWHMEEPVCEPPAIALYYISRLARAQVKVLISGEGGDEAFAGYQNYRTMLWAERSKALLGGLSEPAGRALLHLNRAVHCPRLGRVAPLLTESAERYYLSRLSTPWKTFNRSFGDIYTWEYAQAIDKQQSLEPALKFNRDGHHLGALNRMLYVDTKSWLVDDLLLKADKMTMANSVELRVPLLDHKIMEFAATLPESFKVRGFTTKYIAKRALTRRVPRAILQRRKTGFPVPYAQWLRNDLRSWMQDLLLDRTSLQRGYFRAGALEGLIEDDLRTGQYAKEIFSLVVLELWHRRFLDTPALDEVASTSHANLVDARPHRAKP